MVSSWNPKRRMRFNRFIHLFLLLLLWLLATKSTKYIGKKKQEISTEESASVRLILAMGLAFSVFSLLLLVEWTMWNLFFMIFCPHFRGKKAKGKVNWNAWKRWKGNAVSVFFLNVKILEMEGPFPYLGPTSLWRNQQNQRRTDIGMATSRYPI